jgi:hypothetical protein
MRWLSLTVVVLLAGCDWFTPPCTKLARKVCDVGSEGDACAFLLNIQKDDERAQTMCNGLAVAGAELAAAPGSAEARKAWAESREKLAELGFKTDAAKGRIENKLKAAGGTAGKMVESLEKNMELGEKKITEEAEKLLDSASK